VNVFVPGTAAADADDAMTDAATGAATGAAALAAYRDRLRAEAQRYGVDLPEPLGADDPLVDDHWTAKLAVLREERVPLISFTFGCPAPELVDSLHAVGTEVVVTVTSAGEAAVAQAAGVDALCVQGPEAGAHRGTFDNALRQDDLGLLPLLHRVRAELPTLPLIATGGLADGRDVAAVLVAGARAAQLGTAFLACPESGASPEYKAALTDPSYQRTAVTRAFSGRPARGLTNRFLLEHGDAAPAAYPEVHHLTRGLRRAAADAGDPGGMALWAGQGHPFARDMPAGELAVALAEEARRALADVTDRWARPRPPSPG
jgi:nitronate monooxygenase